MLAPPTLRVKNTQACPVPKHLHVPRFSGCQSTSLSLSVCLACSCFHTVHPQLYNQHCCPLPQLGFALHVCNPIQASCMHAVPLVQHHTHSCVCWSGVRRASTSDQAEQRQDCLEGSAECPDRSDGNMATSQACCCLLSC